MNRSTKIDLPPNGSVTIHNVRPKVHIINVDEYYEAIIETVCEITDNGRKAFQFKDIYKGVCLKLGATEEQAEEGIAYCPYKHKLKNMCGLIRSWIEERSPHSRQYYFRNGKRAYWKFGARPLLFVNNGLGQKNNECNWMPGNHVRGNGWYYNPNAAKRAVQPSESTLNTAAAAYKKTGQRGSNHTVSAATTVIVSNY